MPSASISALMRPGASRKFMTFVPGPPPSLRMMARPLASSLGSSIDFGSLAVRSGGGPLLSSMTTPALSFVPLPPPTFGPTLCISV